MVEIILEPHGLVRRLSGRVTKEEMDSSAEKIQANERIDEMRYNIHDFTAVTDIDLTEDDLQFMAVRAAFSVQHNPRIKIAFVGNHPVLYRLMNAFNNSGCSQHRVCHFDTLGEARRYTGSEANIQ